MQVHGPTSIFGLIFPHTIIVARDIGAHRNFSFFELCRWHKTTEKSNSRRGSFFWLCTYPTLTERQKQVQGGGKWNGGASSWWFALLLLLLPTSTGLQWRHPVPRRRSTPLSVFKFHLLILRYLWIFARYLSWILGYLWIFWYLCLTTPVLPPCQISLLAKATCCLDICDFESYFSAWSSIFYWEGIPLTMYGVCCQGNTMSDKSVLVSWNWVHINSKVSCETGFKQDQI